MKNRLYHLALPAALAGSSFAAERPNILLILTDDQGYHDLSCYGATDFETPDIDRLAASGVRFTDGYVSAPQCGPSRAGLLTGMSQSRFSYLDNSSQKGLPPASAVQTIPELLKDRGYTTGIIGKWHIASDNKIDGHPIRPGNHPWERGFDFVLTHSSGHSHYFPYRPDGAKWMTDRKLEPRLQLKRETEQTPGFIDDLPEDTYLTDYFSEQAAEFVRRNQDQPWFLYLAYNAPHTPMVAREDKLEKYADIKNLTRRKLAAMMDSVDEGVGLLMDELEKTGQTRQTLVWYLSDNGGPTHQNASRNDPFSGKKGDLHEGGIRVPFIASWPGTIPPGQVLSDPVISIDILPTSLAAAGAETIPEIHDSNNLLPWLKGRSACPNEELFWSWRQKAAVRIGSLKETRNGNEVKAIDGSTVPGHIYADLKENPQELPSKALQSPEKKQMLSNRLDQWLRKLEQDQTVLTPQ
jgi:arylsulfatase A-like enzyme